LLIDTTFRLRNDVWAQTDFGRHDFYEEKKQDTIGSEEKRNALGELESTLFKYEEAKAGS